MDKLRSGLSKTRDAIIKQTEEPLRSFVRVDEDMLEGLRKC